MEPRTVPTRTPKSRNGCHRCRTKHIKCDEGKPSCAICQAQGAVCPGYAKQLKWSSKHEVLPKPPRKRAKTNQDAAQPMQQEEPGVQPPLTGENTSSVSQSPSLPGDDSGNPIMPSGSSDCQVSAQQEEVRGAFGWPNFELYGYEDLAFPIPMPNGAPDVQFDPNFAFPFMGDLANNTPHLNHSALDVAESSSSSQALPPPIRNTEDRNGGEEPTRSLSGPANLLQTFYRLTVPTKAPGFTDQDLVNHYFSHVCAAYSCFDSELNPFRTLVMERWAHDLTINSAIQSMAAGNLVNFYPHMASLGLAKRSQAWRSLQQDLQLLRAGKRSPDNVLLSILLLGLSSSWHQASNLGLQYLFVARNLAQAKLQKIDELSQTDEFFLDALIHWEMLSSFVDPVPMAAFSGLKPPTLSLPTKAGPKFPHPWTGLASDVEFILAEIGRNLKRRQRNGLISPGDEEWATTLERALCSMPIPTPDDVADYEDAKTSKADMIAVTRAYRYIGLLETYRMYPDLLWTRVRDGTLPTELTGVMSIDHGSYTHDLDSALTSLATYILELIKPIPISSGVCRLFPLVLLISACQLRTADGNQPDSDRQDETADARYLAEQRMLVLSRKYPQRPLLVMIDILKEVWERADSGASGAHWMDVSHEKSLLTIMG